MTIIKICGIQDAPTALAAAKAGADFLGFVFAPGHRMISSEKAKIIIETVNNLQVHPLTAGVFVNAPAPEVNRIAAYCNLDYVQLSGHEEWDYCRLIEKPVLKVFHVYRKTNNAEIINEIDTGYHTLPEHKFHIILDTGTENRYGGTGEVFDWQIAREITGRYPVFVAGGLTPENIGQLMEEVNPFGVDVSSGVETDGQKDPAKIELFIKTVRSIRRKNVTG